MNEQPNLLRYPRERADYIAGVIVFFGLGAVLFGPLTLGLGYYCLRWLLRTRRAVRSYAVLFGLTGVALVYAYLTLPLMAEQYGSVLAGIAARPHVSALLSEFMLPVWVWSIPFTPGVALMFELGDWLRPKSIDEESERRAERIKAEREKLSAQAGKQAQKGTDEKLLQIGEHQKGDWFEAKKHDMYVHDNTITLNRKIFNQHWLVIGNPGAGKTYSLLRIIWELLSKTDIDVFFVDGKGENGTAEMFRAMAYKARGRVPVFRLGHQQQGARYNGFRGSKLAIYERLGAMVDLGDKRNDPFWDAVNSELLELVCAIGDDTLDAPRSFEEVKERLSLEALQDLYADNVEELSALADYDKKYMQGFLFRMRSFIRPLLSVTDKEGFSLDDETAAIFSIKTMALRHTGATFLKFLVEDLTDYIGTRGNRPGVLIIDEFGAFGNENIIKVLSMARSAELGVILATQNVASLGDEQTRDLIVENTGTQFLMRSNKPEKIAELAGTVMRPEATTHYEDGQAVNKGGVRMQHQYKIDLNEVRGLEPGEGFIIRIGDRAKLTVAEITDKEWQYIGTPPPEVIPPKQHAPKQGAPKDTEQPQQPASADKPTAHAIQDGEHPKRRRRDPDLLP